MAHLPVLRERVVGLLAPALHERGAVVVDATLGLGGHAEALLERAPAAKLVGIDRDPDALAQAQQRLARFADRLLVVHAVYDELPAILDDLGLPAVQGILFDLGVSSMQLDKAERGFSYRFDAPLDMRMDPSCGVSADDVVNGYDVAELTRVIRRYGEERFAHRVAQAIVAARPVRSTLQLAETVRAAIPAATRRSGGHPAKRTFQALRIEVNAELAVLERALPAAIESLAVGGRLVVLSYHSLEDRLVKQAIAAGTSPDVPLDLPVRADQVRPMLRSLSRGAEKAGDVEIAANPRAASVRLRACERLRSAA
ncbi:MAG TPA: 16S rRNA (cytosine(1402)-N(4))-methyltransferase RsmH [Mycobacteriales bacterium]|jgi:16S rRNA (cytosine1402-N4)-methyltransferase|nr:16S rRNA (cytosine(1402)-N(4))-methyltransferase RsmH [Mycobacteriales bacterium]